MANSVSNTAAWETEISSAPPATITVCWPCRMASYAMPMARLPDVQALDVGSNLPQMPKNTDTFTAVVWGMIWI